MLKIGFFVLFSLNCLETSQSIHVTSTRNNMVFHENGTICGLPSWIGVVTNDTTAYRNDIILAAVNGPCALFAFLSNLVIIATVIKKPALQKPSNILLCSLAFADCLTAVTAQPMLVAWRFFLQRAQQSCLHQVFVFDVYYTFNVFTVGLSFVNVVIISCDRHYALSRPLSYLTTATRTGKIFFNIKWFKTGFHFTNYHFYPAASNHFSVLFFSWSLAPDLQFSLGQTNTRCKLTVNIIIVFSRLAPILQILHGRRDGMQCNKNLFDDSMDKNASKH